MIGKFEKLDISKVELDMENPRIVKFLEMYSEEALTGEAVALALGSSGNSEDGSTGYYNLKDSIRVSRGIIHPIIVNYRSDLGKYVAIEGNTRVQIYRELKEEYPDESELWGRISSIVYEDLPKDQIDMIRLQAHLVGPREWDAYSKAKYLYQLNVTEKMPMSQLVNYCGGKASEVPKQIKAYDDMETYYRKALEDESAFDSKEFSKYVELQGAKSAILQNGFTLEDFTQWVLDDKFRMAIDIRKLPKVLASKEATKVFLESDIEKAYDLVKDPDSKSKSLSKASFADLCNELTHRINEMELRSVERIKNEDEVSRIAVEELKSEIDWFMSYIDSGE